MQTHTDRQA